MKYSMCYVFRPLTAVSFFTGGTDMFVESDTLYFFFHIVVKLKTDLL